MLCDTTPLIQLALHIQGAGTTTKPWDGSASRFTPEQYIRSCLYNENPPGEYSKSQAKFPVREPDGTLNLNGMRAALGALKGARGGTTLPKETVNQLLRKLYNLYKTVDSEIPPSLKEQFGEN